MSTPDEPTALPKAMPQRAHPLLAVRLRSPIGRCLVAGTSLALAAMAAQAQAPAAQAATGSVGRSEIMVGNLPVTLVYPTQEAARSVTIGPFVLQMAPDATPAPGKRRLVVLSHGTGGASTSDHDLAATLARAGFVVAQPLHAGDNFIDSSRAGPQAWQSRPGEVSRVIDALATHPTWQPLLQLDKVGVHGMSAGGVSALSLAGAQWRLLDLVRHCLPATPGATSPDPGFCFNGLPEPAAQAARAASFERARGAPEAYLPAELKAVHGGRSPQPETAGSDGAGFDPRPDARVAAVTLAVPVAAIFSAESLARIRVPVGVVSAGKDTMLLPQHHSAHVLRHCKACTTLADLPGAAHFDLLGPWPAAVAQSVGARQAQGGWPEPGFDSRQRDAAWQRIADFYRQQLAP